MRQLGWIIDLTRCVGCHTCTVACIGENKTIPSDVLLPMKGERLTAVKYRRVLERESGRYPNVSKDFVTMSCHHCERPACLESCPVDAITKRTSDGIVLIDQEKCNGCRYCVWACPYGAPQFNAATSKVEKCTFCVHRIDAGLSPACATACLGKAIQVGTDVAGPGDSPEGFADARLTGPSIRWER